LSINTVRFNTGLAFEYINVVVDLVLYYNSKVVMFHLTLAATTLFLNKCILIYSDWRPNLFIYHIVTWANFCSYSRDGWQVHTKSTNIHIKLTQRKLNDVANVNW